MFDFWPAIEEMLAEDSEHERAFGEAEASDSQTDLISLARDARRMGYTTDIERLSRLLSHPTSAVRQEAAWALEGLAAIEAAEPLLQAIQREQEERSLRFLIRAASACFGSLYHDSIERLLFDSRPGVRAASAEALGGFQDASVMPSLRRSVESETDPRARGEMLAAIHQLENRPPEDLLAARRLVWNPGRGYPEQWRLQYWTAELHDAVTIHAAGDGTIIGPDGRSIPYLVPDVNQVDRTSQWLLDRPGVIREKLYKILARFPPDDLLAFVTDSSVSPWVSVRVLCYVAPWCDLYFGAPEFWSLYRRGDPVIRASLIRAAHISDWDESTSAEMLRLYLENEAPAIRHVILQKLAGTAAQQSTQLLREALSSSDKVERLCSTVAIAEGQIVSCRADLLRASGEEDWELARVVQMAAIQHLRRF